MGSYETYRTYIETRPPEVVANIIVCVIHQTNYLLDRQLRQLEQAFLREGGLRERMTRADRRTKPRAPMMHSSFLRTSDKPSRNPPDLQTEGPDHP
jgi:four helix bundle suffix protein